MTSENFVLCELTILQLAASVCSHFTIEVLLKCGIDRRIFYRNCYAVVLIRSHYTADKSMRLAELVLLSHVFIFVGVTPPLLPFICERKPD